MRDAEPPVGRGRTWGWMSAPSSWRRWGHVFGAALIAVSVGACWARARDATRASGDPRAIPHRRLSGREPRSIDPVSGARIDVATGRQVVTQPFGARRGPREFAVGAGAVWLVPERGGNLAVADLRTGEVRRRIRTGVSTIGDVAPAGRTVWLSTAGPTAVIRLDARTGRRLGKPVRVGATALDIEATPERAWVDLGDENTLVGVVTHAPAPDLRAANGGTVFAIALVGMGAVWVANAGDCTLSRIAP